MVPVVRGWSRLAQRMLVKPGRDEYAAAVSGAVVRYVCVVSGKGQGARSAPEAKFEAIEMVKVRRPVTWNKTVKVTFW